MRLLALALASLTAFAPMPVMAGVTEAIREHILPAVEEFSAATADLAETAADDCTAEALRPSYRQAFDAWMGLSHLSFGPLETDGRALAIEFWPDPRGMVARTVEGMTADADPVVDDPESFPEVSVAGRGLMALERLLYDDALSAYGAGDYNCRYAVAISADLSRMAGEVLADWREHAELMRTAGAEGNARYMSENEASQVLYTALLTTIEFDADQRLGRPMGTFDRPRPTRAETWRSNRPLRNVTLSLKALRGLALTMSDDPIPATEAAFDTALVTAEALGDPLLAGVETPQGRLKVEILQQQIRAIGDAIEAEIGDGLGLSAGFNSRDGD
ncbi:imelysin family protein [Paracoccus alkanivorans]|uniref:Signal peptidase n=1 Tax=Paracoccus alkanivorans TaxID=2116655 RepID=A0A3M0M7A4_9RHOB|nr:imelysin family protein [Paracoccus alkanivorans]RMC33275.1 signal peptidase [Paracoccus alkanivorans]